MITTNKQSIIFKGSYSNAKFELIKLNNSIYLKKKLSSLKLRDFKSIEKNNFFLKKIKIKNLKINFINIKNFKELKKKKYIFTKYIDGLNGDLILKNSGLKEVKIIKEFLINYFLILKKNTKWKKIKKKIFLKKILDVKKNIKQNNLLILFKNFEKNLINKLSKIKYYPTGICHGDLTLSNMILKNNRIYLIDFLKTYNEGITQDLAKVYQEFILGWSSRFLSDGEIIRSKIICENIVNKKFFKSFCKNTLKVLEFEIILTLLRIFPYVKKNDFTTVKWLRESLNKIKKTNFNSL